MPKIYFDSETVGLTGVAKLLQFAIDDGPVQFIPLFKGWESDSKTIESLRQFRNLMYSPDATVVGFNCSFDWFVAYKIFHRMDGYAYDSPERPIMPSPAKTADLQTHAIRKSPLAPFAFSKGASRSVAAVRRIPRVAADVVRSHVERNLQPLIPSVCQLKCSEHEVPGSKDLVTLSWSVDGRLSLKNLMSTYGLPTLKLAEVWPLPEKGTEKPWLPYPDPEVHNALEPICDMVLSDRTLPFWRYAELDIHYLRVLEEKLGFPTPDHHDTCTHIVAYTRYFGFPLDKSVLERTHTAYAAKVEEAQKALEGVDLASPKQRLALLRSYDPLIASSKKAVVKVLADSDRPCAKVAQAMLDFGAYTQRLNQVEKCLESRTGRAHPDLRVMGTRTGRKAGAAGLNWQGITQAEMMDDPSEFDAVESEELSEGMEELIQEAEQAEEETQSLAGIRAALGAVGVGDWKQFEIAIGAAVFEDEAIQEDLDKGIDQHCMNSVLMHPGVVKKGIAYPDFKALVDAKDNWAGKVRKSMKPVGFGIQYFCQAMKVAECLGISLEEAERALDRYYGRYKGFAAYRRRIESETQTADTETWARDSVARMARTVVDMTGYKMDWSFEAAVAEVLWRLGGEGIRTGLDGTVLRSKEKGRQSIDQSIRSALLGGAIAIQAAVSRQRGNAGVQAPGANLTKMLEAELWDRYRLPMMNIHDELVFAPHPNYSTPAVESTVTEFTARWTPKIKSLAFDFHATKVWAEK